MSFLKWMGGKSQVVKLFKQFFPDIDNCKGYLEPFLGGANVFFFIKENYSLTGKPVYISDINGELINCYKCVRDNVEKIIPLLEEHQRLHSKKHYYEIRNKYPPGNDMTNVEKAAAFIYLSKSCFGGMWRVNSDGKMNTSFGRNLDLKIVDDDLYHYSKLLKDTKIIHASFDKILQLKDIEGYFCYFDPPYHSVGNNPLVSKGYSKDGYNFSNREMLPMVFKELDKRGCKVMMSNADVPVIRQYFGKYNIHIIQTNRLKNVQLDTITKDKLGDAEKLTEVVITNYKQIRKQQTMDDYF